MIANSFCARIILSFLSRLTTSLIKPKILSFKPVLGAQQTSRTFNELSCFNADAIKWLLLDRVRFKQSDEGHGFDSPHPSLEQLNCRGALRFNCPKSQKNSQLARWLVGQTTPAPKNAAANVSLVVETIPEMCCKLLKPANCSSLHCCCCR